MPTVKPKKNKRQKSRSGDTPMPQGGAGLIRFYQDPSNGIKVSPLLALIFSGVLIVVVILARVGALVWLLGS